MDLGLVRSLWAPEPGWLNTASYGLPPSTAWDEMQEALRSWRDGRQSWERWDESTGRARDAFARLVGVPATSVAVGGQVSEMLGVVAASLPAGARVVVPDVEFTSNLFPWMVHADRGVEVVTVPPGRLADSVTRGTTAVAFSLVQSSSGEVADLDAVVDAARSVDALVVVDATQAVGWLPVDASGVDALVCGGYKWLTAPRGATFLTLGERLQSEMRPLSAGWYAGADVHTSYYGPPLRLAEDARRFDVSPAWFSWVGTAPALEALERVGVEQIQAYDVGLANRFRAGLGLPPCNSAIVSAEIDGAHDRLERAGIRAATRAGSLRASFHLYTTEADVDVALDALVG
ncbi:MAG: aminotransferase class V-fold PLP-dependent enzyme [Actinomycetes bacterium]